MSWIRWHLKFAVDCTQNHKTAHPMEANDRRPHVTAAFSPTPAKKSSQPTPPLGLGDRYNHQPNPTAHLSN